VHKPGKAEPDPLHGRFPDGSERSSRTPQISFLAGVVEYEPDPELRDTEQVPLLEDGGIEAFFHREVLPHVPDAWIDPAATKIGYEISFTCYFYTPQSLRSLEEIRADIEALQKETEGLLEQILASCTQAYGFPYTWMRRWWRESFVSVPCVSRAFSKILTSVPHCSVSRFNCATRILNRHKPSATASKTQTALIVVF
jgi:hypothetical protein